MQKKIKIYRQRLFLIFIPLVFFGLLYCGIRKPVGENYLNDVNRVLGGQKPSAPSVLSVVRNGDYLFISLDTSSASDPDTGNNANLLYFFYCSSVNPEAFENPVEYYDELHFTGQISESDQSGNPKTIVFDMELISFVARDPGDYIYFWATSFDGGRESDHSVNTGPFYIR